MEAGKLIWLIPAYFNYSDYLKLKLGRFPNFSIQYTFDSYPTRFNSVRFLTSILNSSTFDLFSIRNSLEERKSCSFMTWYNSNMCILLRMANSDCKNNARFEFHLPKNPCEQLDWQLDTCNTHLYITNFELSPFAEKGATPNFQHRLWFLGCTVEPVHFGTIR